MERSLSLVESTSASTELIPSSEGNFHPTFSSPDGDIILSSKDGEMLFRVHSFILKMSSAFFRTMFNLPQKNSSGADGILYLNEDSQTLEYLLRMICGLPLPTLDSYDVIDTLLDAIEKYEMPGPLSIIRILVMTPPLLDQPFRLYPVACRFGWEAEAKRASTQSLSYDLFDPIIQPLLRKLSTNALLDLMQLHRSRREGLRARLNDEPFISGTTATCVNCGATIDYHTWRELKYKMILEMDRYPAGDTIVEHGLVNWPEAQACWAAKCPTSQCGRLLYDKAETLRVIRETMIDLPSTI